MWMVVPPLSEVPCKAWFQENIWQSKLSFKNAVMLHRASLGKKDSGSTQFSIERAEGQTFWIC